MQGEMERLENDIALLGRAIVFPRDATAGRAGPIANRAGGRDPSPRALMAARAHCCCGRRSHACLHRRCPAPRP